MYDLPIKISETMPELIKEIDQKTREEVYKAVYNYGIHGDKAELLRALAYGREQYEMGWKDAMDSSVHCSECKSFTEGMAIGMCLRIPDKPIIPMPYDAFCSFGERKDNG